MDRERWEATYGALLVASVTFAYGYLTSGAIENDHFVMLARAHQVLYGDWPVRDFEDPGQPLAYLVSTAAAAMFGPTVLVNVVLSLLFLSATSAVTYLLARRATGSTVAAVVAAAVTIAITPRMYNTTKVIVPIVAMALAWRYADAPTVKRLALVAAWTAVAFLLRHDYLAYVAFSNVVLLVLVHRAMPSTAVQRVLIYGTLSLALIAPWLIYIARSEGLVDYFDAATRFVVVEGRRTAGGAPSPLFYALTAIPLVGLVICWLRRASAPVAFLASACVLLLSMDVVFLRDVLAARVPDVVAPTAVVAAAIAGVLLSRRAIQRFGTLALAAVLLVLVIQTAVAARTVPTPGRIAERASRVTTRLEEGSVEIQPDPARAPLIAYLDRCSAPDDRILVGGFGPEIPVLAHRPFAGGLPSWIPGYYEDPRDISRALARLDRERVGAVVMLDGPGMFARSWPAIDSWIHAHGFEEHAVPTINGRLRVWLPHDLSPRPVDGATQLPCRA